MWANTIIQRRQWHPPVLLPGKPHGRRSLVGAVHGVAKSLTQLSDFAFTFPSDALEEEMATHSSVLAWRIPGTGETSGLQSVGSHGVEHNWSNLAAAAIPSLIFVAGPLPASEDRSQVPYWVGTKHSIPSAISFFGFQERVRTLE